MVSAARLNDRIRPVTSVVSRPLVRLSMMSWLNAWRLAISVDALSSLAPALRSRSASEPASDADGQEGHDVDADQVERHPRGRQHGRRDDPRLGALEVPLVLDQDEAGVEQRRQDGDHDRAAAEQQGPRRDDREHVEQREVARDAARDDDERRDEERVDDELNVGLPGPPVGPGQRERVHAR